MFFFSSLFFFFHVLATLLKKKKKKDVVCKQELQGLSHATPEELLGNFVYGLVVWHSPLFFFFFHGFLFFFFPFFNRVAENHTLGHLARPPPDWPVCWWPSHPH
jgi:hypothetical protein